MNDEQLTGAIAIIYVGGEGNREYLLAVQKSGNVNLVGGGRESEDNSIEDTVRREMHEEVGLVADDYVLKKVNVTHSFVYGNHPTRAGQKAINQVFLAKITDKIKAVPNKNEIADIKWLNSDDTMIAFTLPDLAEIFREVIKEI
ncbi:MAG: NUDIX hydrolase [Candidatus Berkelbacteria bacterium]